MKTRPSPKGGPGSKRSEEENGNVFFLTVFERGESQVIGMWMWGLDMATFACG